MAIEKMELVNISGPYETLDNAILNCIESGCFQPVYASDVLGNIDGLSNIKEENPYQLKLNKITEVLEYYNIEPKIIDSNKSFNDSELDVSVEQLYDYIHTVNNKKNALIKDIEEAQRSITHLEHFTKMKLDLSEIFNCSFIKVRFGRLSFEGFEKLKHYNKEVDVIFYPCSYDDDHYWGLYIAPANKIRDVDRIFASLFFERLFLKEDSGTPSQALEKLRVQLASYKNKLDQLQQQTENSLKENMKEYLQLYTQIKYKFEAFNCRQYASKFNNDFILMGWVPKKSKSYFLSLFKKSSEFDISFDNYKEVNGVTPPTKTKNNFLTKPFTFFVDIYGTPRYNEIDPTFFVSVIYTIIYGIMFADLGQGVILSLAGIFMYFKMKMQLGKILIPCGISGAIFGTIFGSVFGNEELLNPMFKALGFEEKPIEIMSSAILLIIASVGIGIALIICAMFLNVFSSIKKRDFGNALFSHNGLCGIALYTSLLLLIGSIAIKIPFNTSNIVYFGICLPIVLIFFKSPLSRLVNGKKVHIESIGDFIIENFFEL
ncbi:MAG: V-type ATPase 116kDa subunit family protein, partial [bacterium]|nr:V-type ATPase 116kDa subunit family protein [bacterium]